MKDNRISSKMTKRNWLQTGAKVAAALALTVPTWTQAQGAYPNRPIKIVLLYSPGTGSDVLARTIAQSITEKSGHTVIIENKEGAGVEHPQRLLTAWHWTETTSDCASNSLKGTA